MSVPPPVPGYPPIQFAVPYGPRRPGLLTAVGVISIVVGGLSCLFCVSSIVSGTMFMTMSTMTFNAPAPAVQPVNVVPPATMPGVFTTSTNTWTFNYQTTSGGQTVTTTTAGMPSPFPFHIDRGASILIICEAILSLGAAVLLIIAGSMMLRDLPSSWRMHRLYVLLKIPLIVVAAYGTYWMYSGMMNSFAAMSPAGPGQVNMNGFSNIFGLVEAIFLSVLSLIYPVALLIVLATKTSKDYLVTLRAK